MTTTLLFVDGAWREGSASRTIDVINPATGLKIGTVACAEMTDLEVAVAAAERGFALWRDTSAFERSKVIRRAADLLRERLEQVAKLLTLEQGKPLGEARAELQSSADILDWLAEEGRRTYGRLIPARSKAVQQLAIREPVGVVAAFTPWNFPVSQVVRKLGAALAAGCSVVLKAAEETPASPAALVQAFADAGLPAGVLNLVYGVPAEVSNFLVPHPAVRKISFTGSVPVGKHLAAMAGQHMKRTTMELGGHAPVMVFADADIEAASKTLAFSKFRNAGQVCVSPTRFLVQESVYDDFVDRFSTLASAVKVGDGLAADTVMGPLVSERRRAAVEELIGDAAASGAKVVTGGERIGNHGFFLQPTVLSGVNRGMRIMNEEPFGPVALMIPVKGVDDAIAEANRLPYGLAAYAFTRSAKTVAAISDRVETGMLTINHLGLALPEVPFGGMKDSGYGSEGGSEAIESYLNTKFVTQLV
ncbi:NAD-dependent succinate-semialdehyde dehydrogenase [Aestuariivirga sp.]|uniref:NAD-dependent succinate-semialdehyde dehydrogenase n=1 Tax=Aestuariivirga sp. TaxID=2650926 RepID=UPI0035934729